MRSSRHGRIRRLERSSVDNDGVSSPAFPRQRVDPALDRGLLGGLVAFRWLAGAWMVVILVVDREALDRPLLAAALVAAAVGVTIRATLAARSEPVRTPTVGDLVLEVSVGATLSLADAGVWGADHSQSLGSAWPVAGVLTAGIVAGVGGGLAAGAVIGLARLAATALEPGVAWTEDQTLDAASTIVLYLLAGGIAGFAATRLRDADRSLALARARDEVAVELHDGVLQTLAVVQRRSGDPDVARLAHEQERELRDFLFGAERPAADLATALRAAAARYEDRFGGRATVVLGGELPLLGPEAHEALLGATGEALANAGKHGGAGSVTIYAEPTEDDEVFVTINDSGPGYDPADVTEGVGVPRSIRGRMTDVGGRSAIDARPGQGVEVQLWVPA